MVAVTHLGQGDPCNTRSPACLGSSIALHSNLLHDSMNGSLLVSNSMW
jgi:hypothetical protein